jgi:hypothetical protein
MTAKWTVLAIWSLAAAVLMQLRALWDRLPERVAVHFGIHLQPDAWSRKSTMAALVVFLMVSEAALSTWLILKPGHGSLMLAFSLLAVSLIFLSVFWQMIRFNASGAPLRAIWIVLPVVLVVTLAFVQSGVSPHRLR